MAYLTSALLALSTLSTLACAASSFSPARPPAIPLAVKSPYLSTWLFAGSDGGNGGYLAGEWPSFWTGAVTGWAGLIRVDGTPYVWMGNPLGISSGTVELVNQTSFEYTSTRSIFQQNVLDQVGITVTFLSPITPDDYVRGSLVSSYMDVQVYSLDGNTHDVQLYTDISAEWIDGDRTAIAEWDYGVVSNASTGPSTSGIGNSYATVAQTGLNAHIATEVSFTGWTTVVTRTVLSFQAHTTTVESAGAKRAASTDPTMVIVTDIVTHTIITCPDGSTPDGSTSTVAAKDVTGSAATVSETSTYAASSATGSATSSVTGSATGSATSSASSSASSSVSSVSGGSSSTISVSPSSSTALTSSSNSSSSATSSGSSASATATNGIAYHKVWRQTQLAFSENGDQTEYGYWYYMTANTSNLSHQSGADVTVRGVFAANGTLANTADTNYRAINDNYPVFAYALDLGSIGSENASALFTINLNQQNAVQFEGANGNQTVPSLWTGYFGTDLNADSFAYNDYSTVSTMATAFDNQVASDSAAAAGNNYTTITSLAARQAFGALQLAGTPETPYLFLKEISSDGNIQTVDVLFPWHPIAIYANPTLLRLALEPLFINQEAGYWPYTFSIHDLGTHYPNATGHNDGNDEQQPLEECGNMLIMALAYAQRTNDNAWLASHYNILKQWNEYLISEALIPANQISTDDFAGALANQTNLAIKGIIGIEAMAQIANRTGNAADGANYTAIAHSYIAQWQNLSLAAGASPPHTTLNYGNDSTYSLLYNLYADRLLGLQLVPQSVYDMQSAFYPTVAATYGVPLDTRHSYTKSDWEIFCAAIASASTQALFVDDLAAWIADTPTELPFTDLYDAVSGDYPAGIFFAARPVVGGEFAILALDGAPTDGFVAVASTLSATSVGAGATSTATSTATATTVTATSAASAA